MNTASEMERVVKTALLTEYPHQQMKLICTRLHQLGVTVIYEKTTGHEILSVSDLDASRNSLRAFRSLMHERVRQALWRPVKCPHGEHWHEQPHAFMSVAECARMHGK